MRGFQAQVWPVCYPTHDETKLYVSFTSVADSASRADGVRQRPKAPPDGPHNEDEQNKFGAAE